MVTMVRTQSCHFVGSVITKKQNNRSVSEESQNLIGVVLRNVTEVELEQEVMLLQSTEHAGKSSSQAVHPAEGPHADLT